MEGVNGFDYRSYFVGLKDKFTGEESQDGHGAHAACLRAKIEESEPKAQKKADELFEYAFENSKDEVNWRDMTTEKKNTKFEISLKKIREFMIVLRSYDHKMTSKDDRSHWPTWRKALWVLNPVRKLRSMRNGELFF